MIELYQRETCPYCKPVRERLTELGIRYVNINVSKDRSKRETMVAVTGTHFIPALVDGDVVIAGCLEDCSHVLEYIDAKYG
ncbi:glutaredoxin [Burkholderia cenocepacia]|uniref:glutaredoxin family protein n=1 Tax=Burkholderia cenocepacia TaxID=95486 RepID=UPI000D69A32A|nr:glutaredoxin [Burkholderia cenocepacia]HDR9880356.1 glutaredoxin [Burkholderia cenocepacia]HDR9887647.1 glutaredoxin [Burkholderia cenocepacia]